MNDARYHSISLELDPMGRPGEYKLTFSTRPGMSISVTELRMSDLDALASILSARLTVRNGESLTAIRDGEPAR